GHGTMGDEGTWRPEYYQDTTPVRELTDISGHAVRCMYLYCGMADVAALNNDTAYVAALNRLWDDVVLRNMYVTGGIGSSKHNEGFTVDYDLPNLEAYCETCASVGMVYWNQRMNQLTGDSKYADVLERSMYNGALAGVSLAGDRFFYVNPLESNGDHHRQAWYGCACCPSQISRFLPSIGNYIYGTSPESLWLNLFIGSTADLEIDGQKVTVSQHTDYPWDGKVELTVTADKPVDRSLRIRIPGWCKNYTLTVNGKNVEAEIDKGYAVVNDWKPGDKIELNMDMPVEIVAADERVKEDEGKRAIQRGPLVYCIEETDNADNFDSLALTSATNFRVKNEPEMLGGIKAIQASTGDRNMLFVPYYAWDNREAGKMKVWVDYND
ncbi:MAG: glycoside hydrolase family 127 protein, partial [Muribaculaceae bacterium]|nr:glycoside hydrolase family 127 protein [Muribaculaceae bacterium]